MCSKSHSHSPLNVSLPFDFAAAVCTKIFHGYYRRMDTAPKLTNTLAKTSQGERQLHTNIMRPMHIGAGKRKRNLFRSGSCFPTNTFSFLNIFYVYESCKKCTARTNQGIGSACTFSYSAFLWTKVLEAKSAWRWSICSDSLSKLRPWRFLLFRLRISEKKWDHNAILFCPRDGEDEINAQQENLVVELRDSSGISQFFNNRKRSARFLHSSQMTRHKTAVRAMMQFSLESTMEIYIVKAAKWESEQLCNQYNVHGVGIGARSLWERGVYGCRGVKHKWPSPHQPHAI